MVYKKAQSKTAGGGRESRHTDEEKEALRDHAE